MYTRTHRERAMILVIDDLALVHVSERCQGKGLSSYSSIDELRLSAETSFECSLG